MTYATIQPPFTLKFEEMSKKELRDYFAWFQDILPVRLAGLVEAVKQTSRFETWDANLTPASLDQLGEWLAGQVETRPRTEQEIGEIKQQSLYPIEIPTSELTNRTFSLAIDTGMYLSRVFLENYPSLKWDQKFGGKRSSDYGQPVLVGFGPVPFNPVRMMVTQAYGLAGGDRDGASLRELYEIWARMITA